MLNRSAHKLVMYKKSDCICVEKPDSMHENYIENQQYKNLKLHTMESLYSKSVHALGV